MRRFTLLLLAIMTALTVGLAANHKTVRPVFQVLNPDGTWAIGADGVLEWTWDGGGVSTHESNRHGMLLFEAPIEVEEAMLSATLGPYCLPPTPVPVARAHPGKYLSFTMMVCQ